MVTWEAEWSTWTSGSYWRSQSLRASAIDLEKARSMSWPSVAPLHSKVSSCCGRSEKYSLASLEVDVPSPL